MIEASLRSWGTVSCCQPTSLNSCRIRRTRAGPPFLYISAGMLSDPDALPLDSWLMALRSSSLVGMISNASFVGVWGGRLMASSLMTEGRFNTHCQSAQPISWECFLYQWRLLFRQYWEGVKYLMLWVHRFPSNHYRNLHVIFVTKASISSAFLLSHESCMWRSLCWMVLRCACFFAAEDGSSRRALWALCFSSNSWLISEQFSANQSLCFFTECQGMHMLCCKLLSRSVDQAVSTFWFSKEIDSNCLSRESMSSCLTSLEFSLFMARRFRGFLPCGLLNG